MKNIKHIQSLYILIIVLAVFVFSERNNESEPNSML